MAYGTGRVYQRGDTWWMQYSIRGKVVRESAHTTERDTALRELAKRQLAAQPGALTPTQQTMAILCERVLLRYRTKKQASLATAEGHAKAWLAALSGSTPLATLTLEGLLAITEQWEDTYTAATINRRVSFLRLGFRLVGASPLDWAELRQAEDNVREGYIARLEFARIHAEAAKRDPDLADYLGWLYLTGMRRSEAAQLTVDMIDRSRWLLIIPGRCQKNRMHRGIMLTGAMRVLVAKRLKQTMGGCRFLFHRAGERIGDFRKSWATICAAAGFDTDPPRPHDLRRSAVTNMLEDGFTPKEAMAVTGHRTLSTFTRYQQLPEDSLRAKLSAMAANWLPAA